jgi:hypothetical protein
MFRKKDLLSIFLFFPFFSQARIFPRQLYRNLVRALKNDLSILLIKILFGNFSATTFLISFSFHFILISSLRLHTPGRKVRINFVTKCLWIQFFSLVVVFRTGKNERLTAATSLISFENFFHAIIKKVS